jgi:hypothetical protein
MRNSLDWRLQGKKRKEKIRTSFLTGYVFSGQALTPFVGNFVGNLSTGPFKWFDKVTDKVCDEGELKPINAAKTHTQEAHFVSYAKRELEPRYLGCYARWENLTLTKK